MMIGELVELPYPPPLEARGAYTFFSMQSASDPLSDVLQELCAMADAKGYAPIAYAVYLMPPTSTYRARYVQVYANRKAA